MSGSSAINAGTIGSNDINPISRFLKWVSVRVQIWNTVRELSVMTDRELSDIGLSRSDIPRIMRGEFSRD